MNDDDNELAFYKALFVTVFLFTIALAALAEGLN
jgi:hypothetical protein